MTPTRVLIVDDDSTVLNVVRLLLIRCGYEVVLACGPDEALEAIRNFPSVDVVVSDVQMPGMRGPELIREICAISPSTVSVLMTGGLADLPDVPDGVPVLEKPFSFEELIRAVEESLARSAQLSADLKFQMQRSATLQRQSEQLCTETAEAVQNARHIRKRGKSEPD
jgi:DNA-binding NtrC family response regulator